MLITPTTKYQESYNSYIEELGTEERYPYPMDLEHSDFPALVERLQEYSMGVNLPNNFVPNTTFWLIKNEQIVACSHLRHTLNEGLKHMGGHIGLGVRPSMRGKGIGKELLLLTYLEARKIGISGIHIHCMKSNQASKLLLESSGASFSSSLHLPEQNDEVLRYIYSLNL